MEQYVTLVSQILLALATFIFVIYSLVGLYALNTYGNSKSLTMTASIIYSAAVLGLLTWSWTIVSKI